MSLCIDANCAFDGIPNCPFNYFEDETFLIRVPQLKSNNCTTIINFDLMRRVVYDISSKFDENIKNLPSHQKLILICIDIVTELLKLHKSDVLSIFEEKVFYIYFMIFLILVVYLL